MATIKAIEGASVHQIQSGQVIVDLCSVVKELVENSLDAGALSIDIRFKNHGLDCIEVQDNGKGISPDDYETVALKHHTSKLSDYEDLGSLNTFGFRGEALSSLCALSKFHILTARAEDGAVGKRLDFEISGKLKGASVASAQKGTTVSVNELFHNLPVRRKELEKNIKREYGKVIGLLHAYACISVGVRFSVSNQMPKGKKIAVFSTKSNTTTKENVVNVFGAKTLLALIKLDLELEMQPSTGPSTQSARNWSTQATDRSLNVQVVGHISKPVFGEGRQAPDRQMFFVNSRPCALPQVSKAVNEVYKTFNVTQSPFIFANLVMDTNAYDVNVSPDKRTIMLHDQTALLEKLKAALSEMFEGTDQTVPQSTLPKRKLPGFQPLTVPNRVEREVSPEVEDEAEDEDEEEENEKRGEGDVGAAPAVRQPVQSAARGSQPNLIHDWIGRDTEGRKATPMPRKPSATLSKEKQKLVKELQQRNGGYEEEVGDESIAPSPPAHSATDGPSPASAPSPSTRGTPAQQDQEPDPMSTAYDDLFSQRPKHLHRAPPQDCAPIATMSHTTNHASQHDPSPSLSPRSPPIPKSTPATSQKPTPGPITSAFDRMRPLRTPLQTASITVGNSAAKTVTLGDGSPAYKRRRIHVPEDSRAVARFGASPLLARGLLRAQGELEMDSSEVSVEKDEGGMDGEDEEERSADGEDGKDNAELGAVDHSAYTSDPLDELLPAPADDDSYDSDYIDEREKRIQEDEKVARLIQAAEDAAAKPTEDQLKRASQALKNGGNRKEATLQLMQMATTSVNEIESKAARLQADIEAFVAEMMGKGDGAVLKGELEDSNAESKLALTVTKSDFDRMTIIGQFNLGFILAVRPVTAPSSVSETSEDELFIIDQHAADEKYNYERLQRTVTLQSQRLVRPKVLELTAVQEEVVLDYADVLKANGFEVEVTHSIKEDGNGDAEAATNRRICRLLTLPISGNLTFDLSDLDELLHLLSENPPPITSVSTTTTGASSAIPRPKKVQRMLAMRACRSSIMVGKTLTAGAMRKVVGHMGQMDKPWNCPHGRPTMRHLAGLGGWRGWGEGEGSGDVGEGEGGRTDWRGWLAGRGK
ncbi:hypothetical protein LTR08_000184 [Meristemomyces frigidus]|nr:hypothetical protein LTR08_000184 [Meristemomyces frigidus]